MKKPLHVRFPGSRGDLLAGVLDQPDGEPKAHALFAHCFTCSKDLKSAVWICRALAERSIAVLRFDFTAIGQSEGSFADTSFSTYVGDIQAAAQYLAKNHGPAKILVGHSIGGTAILSAAPAVEEAELVVTIASASNTGHFRKTLLTLAPNLETEGAKEVLIGGQKFLLRKEMLRELDQHDVPARVADLGKPLMVFHSPADRVVGIDEAHRIFDAANHPKTFVSLALADHLLMEDRRFATYLADTVSAYHALNNRD